MSEARALFDFPLHTCWSYDATCAVERYFADAAKLGVTGAYRMVVNCGESAGQTVPHLHVHLLAGRGLQWPPG